MNTYWLITNLVSDSYDFCKAIIDPYFKIFTKTIDTITKNEELSNDLLKTILRLFNTIFKWKELCLDKNVNSSY